MLIRIALFLGLATFPAIAADPPGYVIWPKGLPTEGSPQKIQFEHHITRRAELSSPTVRVPSL